MDGQSTYTPWILIERKDPVSSFNVFPNPVLDQLSIQWDDQLKDDLNFQIIDALGRVVRQGQLSGGQLYHVIEMHDLSSAVYTIRVLHRETQVLKKFVKK